MFSRKSGQAVDAWESVFAGAVGLWAALALIKFGNPVILDQQVHAPSNLDELLIHSWPVAWGYALLGLIFVVGGKFWRWRPSSPAVAYAVQGRKGEREQGRFPPDPLSPRPSFPPAPVPTWLLVVPLLWLGWQFVSASRTVDRTLTVATLLHFIACVGAFYLGLFSLARVTRLGPFWLGLMGGFLVVLIAGWKQHFGGLEETRRFFYTLPDWQSYPPEFLKKVSSRRIYSTLFYPNALAGVLLLLLPASLSIVWQAGRASPRPFRVVLVGIIGVLGLGALYWSGSKSGWLIAMIQGSLGLLRSPLPSSSLTLDPRLGVANRAPLPRRVGRMSSKVILLSAALSLGLGSFWLTYQDYFGSGATSVAARFDYWRAARHTLTASPLLGSGPGTFMVSYKRFKPPEAEMARLAHNDFLQQGSDSGWPGMLAYAAWILGAIAVLYRNSSANLTSLSLWIGLTGMALQSFVEFGLYIPALAWPFFLLLGWLLGQDSRNRLAKPTAPA
jgi:O-antigen ligase